MKIERHNKLTYFFIGDEYIQVNRNDHEYIYVKVHDGFQTSSIYISKKQLKNLAKFACSKPDDTT